jgi:uncharacterized glyoxalase superfamily protein PhnB
VPRSPVIPALAYPDVREAVTWLCDTFGFATRWTARDRRAQLAVGDAAVVVMTTDIGNERPRSSAARRTVSMVRVENVDAHHARAQTLGARILDGPKDFPSGERQYNVEDLAGHHWYFSQTIADVGPRGLGRSFEPRQRGAMKQKSASSPMPAP